MKAAAEKGELPFTHYATMLDRQLMDEGKAQLYGTQAKGYNGQPPFIWPIQNPGQVNQRRKQAGFGTTVEEYAVRLGVRLVPELRKTIKFGCPTHRASACRSISLASLLMQEITAPREMLRQADAR